MTTRSYGPIRVVSGTRRQPLVANGVMGMMIFVVAEAMLFAGFISAFTIVKASEPFWPPPGQPRLPAGETLINTAALIASGVMLLVARRRFRVERSRARGPLLASILLGGFFVGFQGVEWVAMLKQGLTLTSSNLGSFFYLIVGVHALHAVAALVLLGVTFRRLHRGWLAQSQLATAEVFWYFVVGMWPILYTVVYL